MAKGKRKLQEITTYFDTASYGKAQLDRMVELELMIMDRISASKRIGLSKVRLEQMTYAHAEVLSNLLRRAIATGKK